MEIGSVYKYTDKLGLDYLRINFSHDGQTFTRLVYPQDILKQSKVWDFHELLYLNRDIPISDRDIVCFISELIQLIIDSGLNYIIKDDSWIHSPYSQPEQKNVF